MTVIPGTATKVRVETLANGSGVVVSLQNVSAGSTVTGYSITRDAWDNFVANVAADSWALINITGGVLGGDLIPAGDSKSAVFTGHVIGTAQIEATSALLAKTPSIFFF